MSRYPITTIVCAVIAILLASPAQSLFACAMCYGNRTDSPLAAGMNWGIMCLLGVVVFVLSGVASFGIFLARRAAKPPGGPDNDPDAGSNS